MTYKKVLFLALLFAQIFACTEATKNTQPDNLFKFKEYISYTSSGQLSVTDAIQINLARPIGIESEEAVDASIISIKPKVSGKLFAKNDHHLTFVPDQKLKPDTEYTMTINLDRLYRDISNEFKKYTFKFWKDAIVIKLSGTMYQGGLIFAS